MKAQFIVEESVYIMGLVEVVSCVVAVPLGLLLLLLAGYTAVVFLAHRRYAQIPCPKGRW